MSAFQTNIFIGLARKSLGLEALGIISAPQCSTQHTPDVRRDVLEIVVHQNVRLPEVIVNDVLDSEHLPPTSIVQHPGPC